MSDAVLKTKWLVIGDSRSMSVEVDPRLSVEKLMEAAFVQRERQFLKAGITDASEFDLYTHNSNTPLEVDAAISDMGTQGDSARQPLRVQSRVAQVPSPHLQQKLKLKTLGPESRTNGISFDDPLLLRRDRLVDEVLSHPSQIVIIRSPPATGKTSLLQLVANKLLIHGKAWEYISFAEKTAGQTAKEFVLARLGTTEIEVASLNMYILLDEAQQVYADTAFWMWLIKGVMAAINVKLKLIIAATYSLAAAPQGSPVTMNDLRTVDYNDMKMTPEESDEMYENAVREYSAITPALKEPKLRGIIQQSCGGHIGCLRISILGVCSRKLQDEGECIRYFLSQGFLTYFDRCFITIQEFELQDIQRSLLQKIFLEGDQVVDKDNLYMRQLIRSAIIEIHDFTEGKYGFTAPIVKRYIFRRVFPGRPYHHEPIPNDIDQLIVETVKQFNAISLQQAVQGSLTSFPKETSFQQMFYKAFSQCVPVNVSIVSEMSSIFKSGDSEQKVAGELDFYIDSTLQWGIELVRQGSSLSEHMQRFHPSGKYSALNLKQYRVVDFRSSSMGIRAQHENLVFVSFGEDFTNAEIRFNRQDGLHQTVNVKLEG